MDKFAFYFGLVAGSMYLIIHIVFKVWFLIITL